CVREQRDAARNPQQRDLQGAAHCQHDERPLERGESACRGRQLPIDDPMNVCVTAVMTGSKPAVGFVNRTLHDGLAHKYFAISLNSDSELRASRGITPAASSRQLSIWS